MSLPDRMRAVEISESGGPEVLQVVERPVPVPAHGQIVIKVAYAGVNRPDLLQRAGAYAPHAPFLMIVKDIEARERPPRLGRKRIPILKWRYLVLAILIVLAGLFVWKVR